MPSAPVIRPGRDPEAPDAAAPELVSGDHVERLRPALEAHGVLFHEDAAERLYVQHKPMLELESVYQLTTEAGWETQSEREDRLRREAGR